MLAVEKRPLKVFLCHAHADRDDVKTLYAPTSPKTAWTASRGWTKRNSSQDRIGNMKFARLCASN